MGSPKYRHGWFFDKGGLEVANAEIIQGTDGDGLKVYTRIISEEVAKYEKNFKGKSESGDSRNVEFVKGKENLRIFREILSGAIRNQKLRLFSLLGEIVYAWSYYNASSTKDIASRQDARRDALSRSKKAKEAVISRAVERLNLCR